MQRSLQLCSAVGTEFAAGFYWRTAVRAKFRCRSVRRIFHPIIRCIISHVAGSAKSRGVTRACCSKLLLPHIRKTLPFHLGIPAAGLDIACHKCKVFVLRIHLVAAQGFVYADQAFLRQDFQFFNGIKVSVHRGSRRRQDASAHHV